VLKKGCDELKARINSYEMCTRFWLGILTEEDRLGDHSVKYN